MIRRRKQRLSSIVHALPSQGRGEIPSDVLGSYTGKALDGSHPIQDADDL